jgi:hypothetical protein
MFSGITPITNPPTQTFECKNFLSATKYTDDVSLLVNKELEKGYLIGPFIKPPFDKLIALEWNYLNLC